MPVFSLYVYTIEKRTISSLSNIAVILSGIAQKELLRFGGFDEAFECGGSDARGFLEVFVEIA
jgi:hypothetical protein